MNTFPQWLQELLGDSAVDIVDLFPGCINSAHTRARDAQDVSGLRQKNPYGGTLWLAVHDEFAQQLGSLPGASLYKPHHASYKLVIINETLIYPYRQANSVVGALADGRLKVTPMRKAIFGLSQRLEAQEAFDFAELMAEEDEDWEEPGFEFTQTTAKRVLLVPFICNADAGLLAAAAGEGVLLSDGTVDWKSFHELDLDLYRSAPLAVMEESVIPRFDNGVLPEPPLFGRSRKISNPDEMDEDTTAETETGTDE